MPYVIIKEAKAIVEETKVEIVLPQGQEFGKHKARGCSKEGKDYFVFGFEGQSVRVESQFVVWRSAECHQPRETEPQEAGDGGMNLVEKFADPTRCDLGRESDEIVAKILQEKPILEHAIARAWPDLGGASAVIPLSSEHEVTLPYDRFEWHETIFDSELARLESPGAIAELARAKLRKIVEDILGLLDTLLVGAICNAAWRSPYKHIVESFDNDAALDDIVRKATAKARREPWGGQVWEDLGPWGVGYGAVQPPSCCCHGWINHPEPEFDKGLLILPPVSGALVLGFHGPEVFDLKCYRDPAGCGYRIQADSCFTYATHGASDWLVIVDREYVVRKAGLKKVSEE